MQNSFNQPDQLRQRISALEAEIIATEAETIPLANRVNELTAAIKNADDVLSQQYSYPAHRNAKEAKVAAISSRAALQAEIQSVRNRVDSAKSRRGELQRDLQRAERSALTDADLKTRQRDVDAAIKSAGNRIVKLKNEVDVLKTKRREAQAAIDALSEAEQELVDANEALDAVKGDAFIDGGNVDIAGFETRITTAQKNVNDAKVNAAGAKAAIPRIDGRILAANESLETETAECTTLVDAYFDIQLRKFESAYLTHARGVMESLQSLVALGQITGNQLGNQLLGKMRHTLYVPADGKHPEAFDTSPWFGRSVVPDVSDITARLTAEFQAVKTF